MEPLRHYPSHVLERVERFATFAALVGLTIEPFQRLIIAELFSGRREILVLLPRGNGKTTMFAALALYHLLSTKKARVICAAATQYQAKLLFDAAKSMALSNPAIAKRIAFRWNYLYSGDGFIRVVASDRAGSLHGLEVTLALVDELHAHPKPDTYIALKTALLKRVEAQLVTISTAGTDERGTLGQLRSEALKGQRERYGTLTIARRDDARFSLLEWACPADADLSDAEVVKQANPATFVHVEDLRELIASPGLRPEIFAQLHANLWTRPEDGWLAYGVWDGCCEPGVVIPDGSVVYLGVDIGIKKDSSSVVTLWPRDDGKIIAKAKLWTPAGDGRPLDLSVVEDYLRQQAARYNVQAVGYDRWSFERTAQMLRDEGLHCLEVPFSAERMVPASAALYEDINKGTIVHDGDGAFAAHVEAGVVKYVQGGWRLAKDAKRTPVDALMAMLVAHSVIAKATSVYEQENYVLFL